MFYITIPVYPPGGRVPHSVYVFIFKQTGTTPGSPVETRYYRFDNERHHVEKGIGLG